MTNLVLAFDVVNNAIVAWNGSAVDLPNFRRGIYATKIYLVQPNPDAVPGTAAYVKFDSTAFDGIRAGIWPTSAGTDANKIALTDQTQWHYDVTDPDNPFFSGNLNLATMAVANFIAGSSSKDAFFAVNLVKGADLYPVYDQSMGQTNCTILAATDPGAGIGVDMTGAVPLIPLPCQFGPDANGKIWVVDGIAGNPPTLQIVCLNP